MKGQKCANVQIWEFENVQVLKCTKCINENKKIGKCGVNIYKSFKC